MTYEKFEQLCEPYDRYSVSNHGYVIDCDTDKIEHIEIDYKTERPYVVLDGSHKKSRKFYLYQLVADNFLPNPDNLGYVYFKDGDCKNVHIDNLGWAINPQEAKQREERPLRAEVAERRTQLIFEINNALDRKQMQLASKLGKELWELEGANWNERASQI